MKKGRHRRFEEARIVALIQQMQDGILIQRQVLPWRRGSRAQPAVDRGWRLRNSGLTNRPESRPAIGEAITPARMPKMIPKGL